MTHINSTFRSQWSILLVQCINQMFDLIISQHGIAYDFTRLGPSCVTELPLQLVLLDKHCGWGFSGVKKSLVLVPGTSWISDRTSKYFHPMSCGQVKNSLIVYFSLTRTSYLVTGQVKILMYLPGGQVKNFRFFYPCHLWSVLYQDLWI